MFYSVLTTLPDVPVTLVPPIAPSISGKMILCFYRQSPVHILCSVKTVPGASVSVAPTV